ncbi:hypothetical protein [Streptomyces carpinensis]|uniref:Uncharacterized protein n=1 Tax=Streptomyces carpinensis TaxID=66369 RepID=A0ABV1WCV7_9ACTN|nr:hypothetical protein [Streptomyces carpinensis]
MHRTRHQAWPLRATFDAARLAADATYQQMMDHDRLRDAAGNLAWLPTTGGGVLAAAARDQRSRHDASGAVRRYRQRLCTRLHR